MTGRAGEKVKKKVKKFANSLRYMLQTNKQKQLLYQNHEAKFSKAIFFFKHGIKWQICVTTVEFYRGQWTEFTWKIEAHSNCSLQTTERNVVRFQHSLMCDDIQAS